MIRRTLLAAELRSLAGRIDRRLADEHNGRKEIAETDAGRLRDLATALAPGAAPVVALDAAQLETVLDALADAAEYRSTHAGLACFDCVVQPGGHCLDHAADHDRADAYKDLAEQLRQEPG